MSTQAEAHAPGAFRFASTLERRIVRRLGEAARRREAHQRLRRIPLWPHISLTTAYWLVSGYGQRWLNALVALALLWLVSALGYILELLLLANPSPNLAEALGTGLFQALFSLILRPIYYPPTPFGQMLNFLQMVLSPVNIS